MATIDELIAAKQGRDGRLGGFAKLPKFGQPDLTSVDGLVNLARSQGGALGEAVEDLIHPQKSLLGRAKDVFKESFSTFVNILATPSEIVAGIIDPDTSIKEAMKMDLRPSDVFFGEPDKDATAMQKVGSFFVRTATDILLDPLTYVTFGATRGIFGLTAAKKISLGAQIPKVALTKAGEELLFKGVKLQRDGLLRSAIKTGKAKDLVGKELDDFVKATIDAELDPKFVEEGMRNLLTRRPELAETLLDKGGIKFFGNTILSGQRINSAIKAIPGITLVDNATRRTRNIVKGLFDPATDINFGKMPEEFTELMQKGKDLITARKLKTLDGLLNVVKSNKLNTNEANLLMSALEGGKIPADERLRNAWIQLKGIDTKQLHRLRAAGVRVSELVDHMPHVLVDEPIKDLPFTLPPQTSAKFATSERQIKGTVEEINKRGFLTFDQNAVTALARRGLAVDTVETMREFVKGVARKFGVAQSKAPAGFIKAEVRGLEKEAMSFGNFVRGTDEALLKAEMKEFEKEAIFHEKLKVATAVAEEKAARVEIPGYPGGTSFRFLPKTEELYFHPAIAKAIEEFSGAVINDVPTAEALKAFDKVQNLWKASVTSIFPAFHGRNAISNVFLHFMDLGVHSFNPANHYVAGDLILKDRQVNRLMVEAMKPGATEAVKNELDDLLTKTIFKDRTGHEWSFGELRNLVKDTQVAFNPNIVGVLDVEQTTKTTRELVDQLFPKEISTAKRVAAKALPVSQEFLPFRVGREVGRAIEEQARLVDFVANLKNTGDPILAAQRTKQFLFDYGNLTNFEKTFMRRMIPFYVFTRRNLELQATALLTTPGRQAAQVTALTNLGQVISGGKLTEEEKKALPDWIKTGINILKTKRGSTVEILGSLGTPVEQPFQAFQPNAFLGSISPVLRVPFEMMTGYNIYQGKPLSDVTNASAFVHAPKVIQDFIGFTQIEGTRGGKPFTWNVSLRPERMHLLLNLPPTSRIFSALKQMEAADVGTGSKALQQLIGVRPFSFDLEQEAAKRERELREKLEDLMQDAGVVGKFKRVFIPRNK